MRKQPLLASLLAGAAALALSLQADAQGQQALVIQGGTLIDANPGIDAIAPHTVIQGSPDTVLDVKGINFVKRTVVYVDDQPVPTEVVSGTEVKASLSQNLLAQAGKLHIVIRNPLPLANPEWGDKSNQANVLVPFAFTTAWSRNKY